MLCISHSGYYAWRRRPESRRSRENRALVVQIRAVHRDRRKRCYGSPRMHEQLKQQGEFCGLHRVARLMREDGIRAVGRSKFKVTTDSTHQRPVAPNILAQDFEATGPNQKWAGDITYIWTGQGWLYLAVVLDLFSRMIIGWSMKPRLTADLVCGALRMAIANRLPLAAPLMHSDRGSQYAGADFQRILKAFGITCSMSRKGNCWDNAMLETFFASLKTECIYQVNLDTREQARREVFDYMEVFYNRERLHSALGYVSPLEFERRHSAFISLAA